MKKNKKKKAFTLIELLAVIVILAIIALIVTISIGRLLDNAKKETFKESVIGVLRSAELYMGKYVLENKSEPAYPMVFTCNGVECSNGTDILDISGKVPKSGSITMVNHKTVTANYLSDGKYCVAGTKTDLQVANSCADIDVTKPTVSVEAEGLILKITMTDNESGIASYCVTTTNNSSTCSWIDTTDTYKEHEVTNGTWYVFAKDKKNNVSNAIDGVLAERITFSEQILIDNPTIIDPSINNSNTIGLYVSTSTNTGNPTYYFRGNVDNNYVSFAGKTWRIVRINEDGTVRLVLNDSINSSGNMYNNNYKGSTSIYYSVGTSIGETNFPNARYALENWYTTNIGNIDGYASKIADKSGNYFCEAIRTSIDNPIFTCNVDSNGHQYVDTNIGLVTVDEAVLAGMPNSYLYKGQSWWTMSGYGMMGSGNNRYAYAWSYYISTNKIETSTVGTFNRIYPVINLKADVTVTDAGTSTNPYVVE